jgi:hypothetical protein
VRERWVFGAYDTLQKMGWIQLVPDRTADTLLPLIRDWCREGTIIVSDGWAAYNQVERIGFEHRVVVHERHFVDPETGVHTNGVENYWQRCKKRLKRIHGTNQALLPSHLDEFLWLERFGKTITERWDNFILTLKENFDS